MRVPVEPGKYQYVSLDESQGRKVSMMKNTNNIFTAIVTHSWTRSTPNGIISGLWKGGV